MVLLSVLDLSWPGHIPRLVLHLETHGYHRFWATEHHSLSQSGSPVVVATIAACMTQRIHIGTAGVLLKYICPAKVVEDFRLLELFFPGRIDLGVAGACIPEYESLYLDGRPPPTAASYSERLRILVDLFRGLHPLKLGPQSASLPRLWLCGTSRASGELAGKLGMNFAFHRYLAGSTPMARDAISAYRDRYRSSDGSPPYAMMACYGACAESTEEATGLWSRANAGIPCFIGAPSCCAEQLEVLARQCGADEIAINLLGGGIEMRLAGYAGLAAAARLKAQRVSG